MPEKSFQFKVATVRPSAAIFADSSLKKSLRIFLKRRGLSIKEKPPVDYVFDLTGEVAAQNLAIGSEAKYLRVLFGENESFTPLPDLNWRVIRTDFVISVKTSVESFLGKLVYASLKDQPFPLPAADTEIYPLCVDDLAAACWQALVLPETAEKEFLVLGKPEKLAAIVKFVENLGQMTEKFSFSPSKALFHYTVKDLEKSAKFLNWETKNDWREVLEKTFHFYYKSFGMQKKSVPSFATQKKKPTPERKLVPSAIKKDFVAFKPHLPFAKKPEIPTKLPVTPKKSFSEEIIVIDEKPNIKNEEKQKTEQIISLFKGKKETPEKNEKRIPKYYCFLPIIFGFLLITLAAWLKPTISLLLGLKNFKESLPLFSEQNWAKGEAKIKKAGQYFKTAEVFAKENPFRFFLFGAEVIFGQFAETGRVTVEAAETTTPLLENATALGEAVLKGQTFDFKNNLPLIKTAAGELFWQFSRLQAAAETSWKFLPKRWQKDKLPILAKIKEVKDFAQKTEKLSEHLLWFFGADGKKKTFLVLLQNSNELRPTGGFIGSFALLTFDDGSLIDFEVKDVYVADGQLKGHVEPPKQIKEILGEETWYLRDANWDPDFPVSAKNITWFLKKELGREVDGVIAFNLEAAKKLVGAFKEVYLPDFGEKISETNLFERAEFWSENQFFPGSNQKSAFLSTLTKQLFENMKSGKSEDFLKIFKAIVSSLDEKEIMMFVKETKIEKALNSLNWDGTIRSPACSAANCFSDFRFLVEANLGINKANYFVQQTVEEAITVGSDYTLNHRLTINYENTAASNSWPGGTYTNWLRIYLPQAAKIEKVRLFNPLISQDEQIIGKNKREEEIKNNKKVVGFLVRVPVRERRTVEITFSQKPKVSGKNFGYLLYWQKQSGAKTIPLSLLVSFPSNWQPVQVTPEANLVSGKLLFNKQLNKDLNFGVELSK